MTTDLLTPETKTEIDGWLAKFTHEQRRSAVIEGLMIAQKQNGGHLTPELIEAVADYIDIPHTWAYEVSTFYTMYEHKPIGKYLISFCTNISCKLCGAEKALTYIKNKLGVGFGETTSDGRFTLKEVECMAACCNAPMMQINDDYHLDLTEEKIDSILDGLK